MKISIMFLLKMTEVITLDYKIIIIIIIIDTGNKTK